MKKTFLKKAGATVCALALASGMSAGTALAEQITDTDTTSKTASAEWLYMGGFDPDGWGLYVDLPDYLSASYDEDSNKITFSSSENIKAGMFYKLEGAMPDLSDGSGPSTCYNWAFSRSTEVSVTGISDDKNGDFTNFSTVPLFSGYSVFNLNGSGSFWQSVSDDDGAGYYKECTFGGSQIDFGDGGTPILGNHKTTVTFGISWGKFTTETAV